MTGEYLPLPEFHEYDAERVQKALAQYGLYDASQDVYPTTPHQDDLWPHRSEILDRIDDESHIIRGTE